MSSVAFQPTGFFARLGAFIVEHVVLVLIPGAIIYTYFPDLFLTFKEIYKATPSWIFPTIYHTYILLFNFFFLMKFETSVGKYIFKMKIRSEDNKKLSIIQIVSRELIAKQISSFIFYLGYLPAAFRSDKRAVHDLLTKTIIIQEKEESIPARTEVQPSWLSLGLQCALIVIGIKISHDFKDKIFGRKIEKSISQLGPDSIYRMNNLTDEERDKISQQNKRPRDIQVIENEERLRDYDLDDRRNLEDIKPEEFNREDFQMALLKENPFLLRQLPEGTVLTKTAAMYGAETYYKFSDFLPTHLQNNEELKTASKSNEQNYKLHYEKFLKEASPLHENRRTHKLIHSDFFNDKPFTDAILYSCILRETKYDYLAEQKFSSEALNNIKVSAITKNIGPDCLPAITKNDINFLLSYAEASYFIDDIIKLNKDPRLLEIKVKKLFEWRNNTTVMFVNKLPLEIQNLKSFQKQIFADYFESIKYLDENVTFDGALLEDFVKGQYKPSRFFSEYQKSQKNIHDVLKKHPNESSHFLHTYKENLLSKFQDKEFNQREDRITFYVQSFPKEILDDDEFHMKVMDSMMSPIQYLDKITLSRELGPKIKKWMLNTCRTKGSLMSLAFGRTPHYVSSDPEFLKELKVACDPGNRAQAKAAASAPVKVLLPAGFPDAAGALREAEASRLEVIRKMQMRQQELENGN